MIPTFFQTLWARLGMLIFVVPLTIAVWVVAIETEFSCCTALLILRPNRGPSEEADDC